MQVKSFSFVKCLSCQFFESLFHVQVFLQENITKHELNTKYECKVKYKLLNEKSLVLLQYLTYSPFHPSVA